MTSDENRRQHHQAAETAVACAPAQFAKLRSCLEDFAKGAAEPHRISSSVSGGVTEIGLQVHIRDYTDIRERWEARWNRRPHPPKRFFWHQYRTYRADRDWSDRDIQKELARLDAGEREIKDKAWAEESPDPPPPGYEDDYDIQDWFFDLRHGLEWHRPSG